MRDHGIFLHSYVVTICIANICEEFWKVFLEAMALHGNPAGPALMEPISAEPGRGHNGRHGCKVGSHGKVTGCQWMSMDVNGTSWYIMVQNGT